MIRSSGFRSFASIASRRGCSSTNRLRNQALRCTVAANVNNILPGQPLRYYVGSNSSCGAFSTSANKTNEQPSYAPRPFSKLLAANRGEIATRILRAGTELGCSTVALYSHEDRFTQHRWFNKMRLHSIIFCSWFRSLTTDFRSRYKADQAFQLSSDKSPVAAYLDIDYIVDLCVQNGVNAVHPGYGFLSENAMFAQKLETAGVVFVGPTVDNL